MEHMHGARYQEVGHRTYMPSPRGLPSQYLDVSTNPETLQTPSFRHSYGGVIMQA